jgi:hypothetical protein
MSTNIRIILRFIFSLEGSVLRKGEEIKAYRILGRESEGNRPFGRPRGGGHENNEIHVK